MTKDSLHDLAVRLCEGGIVEFQGLSIKAEVVPLIDDACYRCEMDCLCHEEMTALCLECDALTRNQYLLKLVNP